eukprot:TRINITY_DN37_c0_g1_i1.p1 TRINITY_DN37_c0_g1~~TRINITY_DN37_c0_g1_i1.p1  ORF type:complete len:399 (-),score=118.40 TRINITY_DN37_c0_g1_i1:234-1319(-)
MNDWKIIQKYEILDPLLINEQDEQCLYKIKQVKRLDDEIGDVRSDLKDLCLAYLNKLLKYLNDLIPMIKTWYNTFHLIDVSILSSKILLNANFCLPNFINESQNQILSFNSISTLEFSQKNTLISQKDSKIIVSGSHQCGKTTLLRTIGAIQILAQAGLPVPCSSCDLLLLNSIVAVYPLLNVKDSLFASSMKRLATIFTKQNENQLILLDEPFNGTNPMDAHALTMSLLEEQFYGLVVLTLSADIDVNSQINANTQNLLKFYKGEMNLNMKPTFHFTEGFSSGFYGILLAEQLNVDQDFMNRVQFVHEFVSKEEEISIPPLGVNIDVFKEIDNVYQQLLNAKTKKDIPTLLDVLQKFYLC